MLGRRRFLTGGTAAIATLAGGFAVWRVGQARAGETFEVSLGEAEWRERLSPEAFAVLRQEATERPYSSPLNDETRAGLYACAGCGQDVYPSETKYDSGTGWPSFWAPVEGAVATKVDYKLIYPRTEVHCDRCGGHLGHIFDDGPAPTGKRHAVEAMPLAFRPTAA